MKKPTPITRPNSATTPDGEIPVLRWSNRRRMAWKAFWALLIFTAFYWFGLPLWFHWWALPTTWLDIIGESYFWFSTTMAAVIISYMGFTSLPFWGKGRMTRGQIEEQDVSDGEDGEIYSNIQPKKRQADEEYRVESD